MNQPHNGSSAAPDSPPLVSLHRQGQLLSATVLHPAVADLLWLLRERLTAIHGCNALRLSVHGAVPAIELLWQRPGRSRSLRRQF